MPNKLYYNTVSPVLSSILKDLMQFPLLDSFRLVGGTALSLQVGHRSSVDIDLFSDSHYGEIDFKSIYSFLLKNLKYVSLESWSNNQIGNSCFIGPSENEIIKLDLFYTDLFVFPLIQIEDIRMASIQEIAAMKMDLIARGGRKKDFWDVHALLDIYNLSEMLGFYCKKYPYGYSKNEIISGLIDFERANHDPDPICYFGKYWELIKLDLVEWINPFLPD